MKRIECSLLLLLAAGCVTLPASWRTNKPKNPPAPAAVQPDLPPVTADQVNERNARQQAAALRAELERDRASKADEQGATSANR